MNVITPRPEPPEIHYPESDGLPMSDNTRQFCWIVVLYGNLAALFRDRADVFVSGNQNWYPVVGHPEIVQAPDVYVVFGRPKGHRPSYKQWEENDVPMTVVFEVLSPGNTLEEMARKLLFYEEHGVEEYYIYDPDSNNLTIYRRGMAALVRVRPEHGYVSPRLGIRFDLSGEEMVVHLPDGEPFLSYEEMYEARLELTTRANLAETQAMDAQRRALQAETQVLDAQRRALQAETQVLDAQRRALQAETQAMDAQRRALEAETQALDAQRQAAEAATQALDAQRQAAEAARRASRALELSRRARRGQATPEELAELERLESEVIPQS